MKIEVFIKRPCLISEKSIFLAEELSQRSDHTYKVYTLGEDFSADELAEQFPNDPTLPQIKIDGDAIGGHEAFSDMFINRLY
jgi:glutaredoxin-related protein